MMQLSFARFPALLALLSLVACEKKPVNLTPHHVHVVMPTFHLDGTEIPMRGKAMYIPVKLPTGNGAQKVWVTSFHGVTIDEDTSQPNTNYLCHAHLSEGVMAKLLTVRRFLGLHGGSNTFDLPPGFAVAMEVKKERPLVLYGMAADYAHKTKEKNVHYDFDFDYYDDEQAKQLGIKDLSFQYTNVMAKEGEAGSELDTDSHSHWYDPPGRHEHRTVINDQIFGLKDGDIRVHHIHLHLHPYSVYGEVFDLTANKLIWRGYSRTFPDRSVLESIDRYSSTEGFVMYKDHKYELRCVYDNPKKTPISAMMTARFFYEREPAAPKELVKVSQH